MASPPSPIRATLNYLAPIARLVPPELPFRYAYTPPPGRPEHNEVLNAHQCTFQDLRFLAQPERVGLDRSGFQAIHNVNIRTKDFSNDAKICESYYPEIVNLLKEKLKATRVEIFDHTIRRRDPEKDDKEDKPGKRQPVLRVHVDQTPDAGINRVVRHMGTESERLLKTRVQIINVWRPLVGPVMDSPLGVCHAASLDWDKDLVVGKLLYRDRTGSTYLVHHNPDHEWYYLSAMMPDEVMLIKCYDNKLPKAVAVHSGFVLSTSPTKPYISRQSIELRCLVFYEDEQV